VGWPPAWALARICPVAYAARSAWHLWLVRDLSGVSRAGAGRRACAGRSGWAAGAVAVAWRPSAAGAAALPPGALGLVPAASRCSICVVGRVGGAPRAAQGPVADLGGRAGQGRLVGHPPGDRRLGPVIAAGLETVEPGRPSGRRGARCRRCRRAPPAPSCLGVHGDQPARSATTASKIPMPEHHSAQLACRWARRGPSVGLLESCSSRCTCQ
jgi:hypothetical protein